MATLRMQGLKEYEEMLSKLDKDTVPMIGRALYEGGKVVADEFRREVEALPVVAPNVRGTSERKLTGITSEQKRGLLQGLGIAKMRSRDGVHDIKIGFDGYNSVRTQKYPGGQPNAMIARSVNTGSSFRVATHFADRAARNSKARAEKAMQQQFDKDLKKNLGLRKD